METGMDIFQGFRCPRWAQLPSLSLYMDQVLLVLEEALGALSENSEPAATSTMVNNYVKLKLLPSPDNKKYAKEHIAKLLMVSVLKRAFSISEIGGLFELFEAEGSVEQAYDLFCEELERAVRRAPPKGERENPLESAMRAALSAFGEKLIVQGILADAQKKQAEEQKRLAIEKEAKKEAQKVPKSK